MDLRTKIEIGAAAAVLAAITFAGISYHNQSLLNATAQAKVDAQQTIIDAQAKVYKDAGEQMKKNDADYQDKLDDLMDAFAKVKTPQQALNYSRDAVGPLSQPMTQAKDLPSAAPAPEGKRTVTVNNDDAIVPSADFLEIAKKVNACQKDSLALSACTIDKSLMTQQRDAAKAGEDAANVEAHDWKIAAKGGSWKKRLIKSLKVIGCAGMGGAAGSLAQNRQAGAAIGAASGAAACAMF